MAAQRTLAEIGGPCIGVVRIRWSHTCDSVIEHYETACTLESQSIIIYIFSDLVKGLYCWPYSYIPIYKCHGETSGI